ncbi:MAG TPA: histidine kinase [Bacteroidales bacterium]
MIQNKNNRFVDLIIWTILYLVWVFVFKNQTLTLERAFGVELCYLVFIAFNYYFHLHFSLPKLLNKHRYLPFTIVVLISFLLTSLLRSFVVLFINSRFYHISMSRHDFINLYFNSLLNIFIWTALLLAVKIMFDKIKLQRYSDAVEKEKISNELNFLRSQNEPHFLFNSLNSIYFQIEKSNKGARDSLMRLSEMMRYQLYECNAERIAVEKEIAYLKNYIELQKLRLNKNYKISFKEDFRTGNFSISPLLLIPLVENAFKHVSNYPNKTNEIHIELSGSDSTFKCKVSNTFEDIKPENETLAGGVGLKNLERRLALLYPERHQLLIEKNDNVYLATLILHLHEN